jgi:hypothetical protein
MYGDTYYLAVRDFPEDGIDIDPDNAYSFTATVHPELDTWERNGRNGLYQPYPSETQEDETIRWNRNLAKTVTCSQSATEIVCGPITGYLSFRGDQDWYKLQLPGEDHMIPKEAEVDPPTMGEFVDWDIFIDYSYSGTIPLIGYADPFKELGPELGPGSGTWGDGPGECSYYCGEYHTPGKFYLWVFNPPKLRSYDFNNPYTVTIRATRGCPANCESGRTDYCSAACTAWCCPNPNKPEGTGG